MPHAGVIGCVGGSDDSDSSCWPSELERKLRLHNLSTYVYRLNGALFACADGKGFGGFLGGLNLRVDIRFPVQMGNRGGLGSFVIAQRIRRPIQLLSAESPRRQERKQ